MHPLFHTHFHICLQTSGGGWTRVGLATPQSVGKVNYITSSASNVPSDGVDNGYLGVSYQAGTSYETYMPSNKVGYKLSDADINTLATSVFWGRGINLIKKSYYWNAAQCTNFKSTVKSAVHIPPPLCAPHTPHPLSICGDSY
jgi:hypothetical protein